MTVSDSGERDGVTLAAWYQNILDTQDNPPVFRQLIADLAALINEGKFDGARRVPDRPPR